MSFSPSLGNVMSCPVQGDVIIRQGDNGDFFYVVDAGSCEIFVDGVGKVRSSPSLVLQQHHQPNTVSLSPQVLDVGPGGSFGELALMYNAPRAATVVSRLLQHPFFTPLTPSSSSSFSTSTESIGRHENVGTGPAGVQENPHGHHHEEARAV